MKLPPASTYASRTASDAFWSVVHPNVLPPRQRADTRSPLRPSLRISMDRSLLSLCFSRIRRLAVFLQHSSNLIGRHRDLHAGTLLLQQHRDARVALGPAPVERFGHLLERQVGDAHGHAELTAERRGERHVLVCQ